MDTSIKRKGKKVLIKPSILLAFLLMSSVFGKKNIPLEVIKDWSQYSKDETESTVQYQEERKRNKEYQTLQIAKYYIVNGNLEMASFYLNNVNDRSLKLRLIKKRYLSLIAFIHGSYKESLNHISSSEFNDYNSYKQICLLRVANLIALNNIPQFNIELANCSIQTSEYGNQDQLWLGALGEVKKKEKGILNGDKVKALKNILGDPEYTKIWMKLALFLNKEELISQAVPELPSFAYKSKKIRELIGFAYYRLGKKEKALDFIEDIQSPNADNIRGNLNLENQKYELAFGHFKLALQKRENSLNALERAIPLAWILGQWKEGIKLLDRLVKKGLDPRKKLAVNTAFQIRLNRFKLAREQLGALNSQFKKNFPLQIDLMDNYVSLRLHDNKKVQESAERACLRYDGLNCWISMQTLIWENLGKTIERKDETFTINHFSIEKLKSIGQEITPLKERLLIDQKDIEELDSHLVRIGKIK